MHAEPPVEEKVPEPQEPAAKQLSPRTVALSLSAVVVLALGAVAAAAVIESKKDLVADVPGLGKFVIRDPKDVIQSRLFLGQEWEPGTVAIFRKYIEPGMNVADLGAYNGVHTVRFAKLIGPTGHVYAFEPNPVAFSMLTENIRLNHLESRVDAFPVGVSDEAATTTVVTPNAHNLGGTNTCTEEEVREHRRGCDLAPGVASSMVRIDDDVNRWFPKKVGFLKIDVEGFEDHVLKGAKAWIARDRPLLWIEIWDDRARAAFNMKTTSGDVIALIESLGYRQEAFLEPTDYLFVPIERPVGAPLVGSVMGGWIKPLVSAEAPPSGGPPSK